MRLLSALAAILVIAQPAVAMAEDANALANSGFVSRDTCRIARGASSKKSWQSGSRVRGILAQRRVLRPSR